MVHNEISCNCDSPSTPIHGQWGFILVHDLEGSYN